MARLERDVKRAALLGSSLFAAMRSEELDEILKFASERRFRRGQTIFQRGDSGSSMMAVLRGRVRISSVSADGKEVTLNVISPGEIFGEFALLDGKPRSNDAAASEDTLLLVVERRYFIPFLAQNQDLTLRLLAVLCDKLRRTSMAPRRARASTSSCGRGARMAGSIWRTASSCCAGRPHCANSPTSDNFSRCLCRQADERVRYSVASDFPVIASGAKQSPSSCAP